MFSIAFALALSLLMAYAFAFINGVHDTANAIATTVATRALSPRRAIALAAVLNFVGAYVSTTWLSKGAVASTISKGLVYGAVAQHTIIAALLAAILWGLATWYLGLPSSSSHALIGGLLGAAAFDNLTLGCIQWKGVWDKVILPLFTSPIVGALVAFFFVTVLYQLLRPFAHRAVTGKFAKIQIISASFMAFSHGSNDTQKTMGIVTLALTGAMAANPGALPAWLSPGAGSAIPLWVIISCAVVMALGTSLGGLRIIRTMGDRMIHITPVEGFAAETSAALVIEGASLLGAPVSTTHVISSAIMGVGAAKRLSAVRWRVVFDMVLAWIITIPVSALVGGVADLLLKAAFGGTF